MVTLRTHHLTGEVAGRRLFSDVTLEFSVGWTGLIGPNGAGKSTLLSMLAGLRRPDAGHVELVPKDAVRVLLPQHTERTEEIDRFAEAHDADARRWRGRLELVDALDRWETLSFGERKRWQLGAALWRSPEVLLLDEPTNHLDVAALELIASALERARVIGVLVSHDRATLDRLTSRTVRLTRGVATLYEGNATTAREQWVADESSVRAKHSALGDELSRLSGSAAGSQRAHEAATRQRSTAVRMRSKYDSDARGLLANFRTERAQQSLGRAQKRVEAQRARVESQRDELDVVFDESVRLELPGERCPNPVVARLERGVLETPSGEVLVRLEQVFTIGRADRVALVGPNGAGKTTLLRHVAESVTVPMERVLSMPQDLDVSAVEDVRSALHSLPAKEKGTVLQWVHALGVDPDAVLASPSPSAGEARLLHLAIGLTRSPWLVLLDEPTNHLAMPLIERLESALSSLECALVVVSHDLALVSAVATRRWVVSRGQALEEAIDVRAPAK